MGKRGPNASKEKPWADALRLAANDLDPSGLKKLRAIAEKTVEMAMDGDIQAIREVGDRLDGKPHQTVDASGELDVFHHEVKDAAGEFTRLVSDVSKRAGTGDGSRKPH